MPKKAKLLTTDNRIWIELDKPRDAQHAEQICKLANRMLQRLCKPEDADSLPTFDYDAKQFKFTYGGPMGHELLSDNGKWFNLDFFGRD